MSEEKRTLVRHADGGETLLTDAELEMFASRIERGELEVVAKKPAAKKAAPAEGDSE